jgi:hypothetical protein
MVILLKRLLLWIVLIILAFPALVVPAQASGAAITKATLGTATKYSQAYGDTFYSTWADDDNIYVTADDTTGWNNDSDSNFLVMKLTGTAPASLSGTVINKFRTAPNDYGPQKNKQGHQDGVGWKANGITSVDGVLYLSISRHGVESFNNTIIKSTDHGVTWSGSQQNSFDNPMFSGTTFPTLSFVEYEKDYKVPNGSGGWTYAADTTVGVKQYVYAVSNDGFWTNGNSLILGRVERSKLSSLLASDWSFYKGNGADGLVDANWSSNVSLATPILSSTNQVGQVNIQYVKGLDRYIMNEWHYPDPITDASILTNYTTWDMYEAPSPWGPWTKYHTRSFTPQGYYNPAVISKSISSDGKNMTLLTSGDYFSFDGSGKPEVLYNMTAIPLTLATGTAYDSIVTPTITRRPTDNVLWNDSFESTLVMWQDTGNSTAVNNASLAHSGNFSMRIGTGTGGRRQYTNLSPEDQNYQFSVYGKMSSSGNTGVIGVKCYDSSFTLIPGADFQLSYGSELTYTQKSTSFTIPANTALLETYISKTSGSGYFYADDIRLANELVADSGFEQGLTQWTNLGNTTAQTDDGNYAKTGTAAGGVSQTISSGFNTGQEYKLTAWGKVSAAGANGYIGVKFYNSSNVLLDDKYITFTNETAFTRKMLKFALPATTSYMTVYTWKGAGTNYFSTGDISLSHGFTADPVNPHPNLVLDSRFEHGTTNWIIYGTNSWINTDGYIYNLVGNSSGVYQSIASGYTVGKTYQLNASGKVTASGDTGYVGVKCFNSSNAVIAESYVTYTNEIFYTKKNTTITVPSGTTRMEVYTYKTTGSQYFYADDVTLNEL